MDDSGCELETAPTCGGGGWHPNSFRNRHKEYFVWGVTQNKLWYWHNRFHTCSIQIKYKNSFSKTIFRLWNYIYFNLRTVISLMTWYISSISCWIIRSPNVKRTTSLPAWEAAISWRIAFSCAFPLKAPHPHLPVATGTPLPPEPPVGDGDENPTYAWNHINIRCN